MLWTIPVILIMTDDKTRTLPLPWGMGGISIVGSIVLLVVGKMKG